MKLLLFFALLFLLVCLALWAFSKLIKTWFNLETLLKAKKNPGSIPHSEGSIVFNKRTGKLEETAGHPLLPFE